jgi:dipeptidyl aminopeptidase/acylaminoacyl peptidase
MEYEEQYENVNNDSKPKPFFDEVFIREMVPWLFVATLAMVLGGGCMIAVLLVSYKPHDNRTPLKIDEVFSPEYTPKTFNPYWSSGSDNLFYYELIPNINTTQCLLKKFDYEKKEGITLFTFEQLTAQKITCTTPFVVSNGDRYIVFKTELESRYRYSTQGKMIVMEISNPNAASSLSANPNKKQDVAEWCKGTNKIAFIEDNNIFVRDFDQNKVVQVTTDGKFEEVFNGVADWLYEEDVWGEVGTFKWSQDCNSITYLKLNDKDVKLINLEYYGNKQPYSETKSLRYPKVGEKNPEVEVHVYSLTRERDFTLNIGAEKDIYIFDIQFKNNGVVSAIRVNRQQNVKDILLGDFSSVVGNETVIPSSVLLSKTSQSGWIVGLRTCYFLPGSNFFVDLGIVEGYYHTQLYDSNTGNVIRSLSVGKFDDAQIYQTYVDGKIYIQSAGVGEESTERRVYEVIVNTGVSKEITSTLLKRKGSFFSASFSGNGKYMILASNGPNEPEYVLKATTGEGQDILNLQDNSDVADKRAKVGLPKLNEFKTIEHVMFDGTENRTVLTYRVLIQYPPRYTDGKNYPTVLNIYNGPGSQSVVKSFSKTSTGLNALLVSQGFVVVSMDGRGTGFMGEKHMHQVYKKLGVYDTEDTINVGKWIKNQNFSKKKQISLWGWSYGGYSAIKTYYETAKDEESRTLFRYIFSGAPVTDWTFYDTAYTERYMLTPSQNPIGYLNSTCLDVPSYLNESKSKFVLIHGTADDNVHILNSYHLMKELQKNDIIFDTMIYPDENHGIIRSGPTTKQLQKSILAKLMDGVNDR